MSKYEIIFPKKCAKAVFSLKPAHKEKLKAILVKLSENPYAYPYKKIRGEENLYRIRIETFRIIYHVDSRSRKITILKIDKRSRVYKR